MEGSGKGLHDPFSPPHYFNYRIHISAASQALSASRRALSTYYVLGSKAGPFLEAAGRASRFFSAGAAGERPEGSEKARRTAPCRPLWKLAVGPAVGKGRRRQGAWGLPWHRSAPPFPTPEHHGRAIF